MFLRGCTCNAGFASLQLCGTCLMSLLIPRCLRGLFCDPACVKLTFIRFGKSRVSHHEKTLVRPNFGSVKELSCMSSCAAFPASLLKKCFQLQNPQPDEEAGRSNPPTLKKPSYRPGQDPNAVEAECKPAESMAGCCLGAQPAQGRDMPGP